MDSTPSRINRLIKGLLIVLILPFFMGCEPAKPAVYAWFPEGGVEQVSPSDGYFYQASIHPEGRYVTCSGNFKGTPRIWKIDLSTKNRIALSPEDAASIHGVFSWDGKKIAFASDMNSVWKAPGFNVEDLSLAGAPPPDAILNIFIMDSDGSNLRQLTYGSYQDQRPTFSPDGKYIVFVNGYATTLRSGRKRRSDSPLSTLWIVPTNGHLAPKVIPMKQSAYRPWFSADGKRLYFFADNLLPFRQQICSMPVEGGNITRIASDDKGMSHGPFIDPGGDHLLMHSTRNGRWKIYEISLRNGILKLLEPPGFKYFAAAHATRATNGVMTFDASADAIEKSKFFDLYR